ncbi:MAG: TIGR01212 family radical SAM protein [bacterium]
MFKYTLDNKRYHTLNYFLKNKFNSKIIKIPIDAGFKCPNKDIGGCIYCKDYSAANIIKQNDNLIEQFTETKEIMIKKWPNSKFIAYFQAGTNTFDTVDNLRKIFEPFLDLENVVGLSIATRPDSITKECLDYLKELNERTFLTIELGLQSQKDDTLKIINRGHTKEDFTNCVKELQKRDIFTVAHIINGLPFETKEDMLSTASYLNELNIDAIKIHMLFITKDTNLEKLYIKENFNILTKEQYIDIVCDQLEIFNENIVIERITGDPVKEELITPTWLLKKFCVLNDIDKEMKNRNTYQGSKNKKNQN